MGNFKKIIMGVNGSITIEGGANWLTLTVGAQSVTLPTAETSQLAHAVEWANYAASRNGLTDAEMEIAGRQIDALTPTQYANIANREGNAITTDKQPF